MVDRKDGTQARRPEERYTRTMKQYKRRHNHLQSTWEFSQRLHHSEAAVYEYTNRLYSHRNDGHKVASNKRHD